MKVGFGKGLCFPTTMVKSYYREDQTNADIPSIFEDFASTFFMKIVKKILGLLPKGIKKVGCPDQGINEYHHHIYLVSLFFVVSGFISAFDLTYITYFHFCLPNLSLSPKRFPVNLSHSIDFFILPPLFLLIFYPSFFLFFFNC